MLTRKSLEIPKKTDIIPYYKRRLFSYFIYEKVTVSVKEDKKYLFV